MAVLRPMCWSKLLYVPYVEAGVFHSFGFNERCFLV
ncbi:hypothetical protein ANAPC1_00570 [Anaplasma phagocytophilum]|uniref:Uncharacterized protein n=1 Tax=Anaplasma phagocytophilum TaxID=948 RepID=A0AA45UTA0_ANAPH|nr:hypothetical protein ANAPC1_00570 [Anaplasma phagocytophilum]SBO31210.1 hypothetical protein ANAPC4_00424 [Anaplasma phagocytophilum]SBO31413.1 hypothetical protein ANAPC2_00644 [Anaplasma phagocytophilum]SBO31475.1 hypothetical protein ANAPC3_00542 [Anaplasma phagocytophilum]SCV63188.1 hypothetical protein ANAPC5_00485 [Anaplasma phagocytophilum]